MDIQITDIPATAIMADMNAAAIGDAIMMHPSAIIFPMAIGGNIAVVTKAAIVIITAGTAAMTAGITDIIPNIDQLWTWISALHAIPVCALNDLRVRAGRRVLC